MANKKNRKLGLGLKSEDNKDVKITSEDNIRKYHREYQRKLRELDREKIREYNRKYMKMYNRKQKEKKLLEQKQKEQGGEGI